MHIVQEDDIPGERMDPPHARVVKHLVAPWNMGTSRIWLGISVVDPGSSSNLHSHKAQEEVFYCLSGRGIIRVGDEEAEIRSGNCVYIPENTTHQLVNTESDQLLRVLSATAPAFDQDQWSSVHARE